MPYVSVGVQRTDYDNCVIEFALVDHTIPLAEFYDSPFKTPLYQLLLLRKAKRVAVIFKDLL